MEERVGDQRNETHSTIARSRGRVPLKESG